MPAPELMPTGHAQIDADHGELRVVLEGVLEALEADCRWDVRVRLEALVERFARHFAYEELLMRVNAYPDLKKHKEAHDLYLADAARFQAEVEKSGITEAFRRWAGGRMLEWARFHVSANDVSLGSWLAARPGALPAHRTAPALRAT